VSKVTKLLLVFALIFMFASAVSAYVWDPKDWIVHDDVAAQEEAKAQEGVYAPFGVIPAYPFGGTQNITEQTWPASMRKGMLRHMTPGVADWFKTPAFDYSPGKHNPNEDLPGNVGYITTQQEILDWFAALPQTRMQYKVINGFPYYTGTGYQNYALARTFEMVFAVFSKPLAFTPEEVKAVGKPVVWFHASIHGGETGPGEALLQVAKEFAEGKHDDILDKITVIIIPRFNVDGAWNNQRQSTGATPTGSDGATANGMDMNRDFIAFETPLVRQIRQLAMMYDPIVGICGHQQGYTMDSEQAFVDGRYVTTNYRRGYEAKLTTIHSHNLNIHQRVRDLGHYILEPAIKEALEANLVGWNRYVGGSISAAMGHGTFAATNISMDVVSSDGVTGPLPGRITYTTGQTDFILVPEEGIGLNGMGLGNQSVHFVTEVASVGVRLDYLRRAYACYLAYMATARTTAQRLDYIMEAVTAAKAAEVARTEPISFWGIPPIPVDYDRNVIEFADWRKADTPEVVNSIRMGKRPQKWVIAHFAQRPHVNSGFSVHRPIAYIIPKDHYEAAIRLFYMGVKLERLTSDQEIEVEAYTVTETGSNNDRSPTGSVSQVGQGIRNVSKATVKKTFPKDSFVVRMNQLGASYVGLAIEPMAIRNYGNMYLSRSPNAMTPDWYRDTFFPVAVGKEYPSYRYVNSTNNAISTYPANMNLPFTLTMVKKVHAFTQEEVAKIKDELGLGANPQFLSKFELPVLSTDLSYRNMANVLINESFILPNGTVVQIKPEFIVNNTVTIVAPKGLEGLDIFAATKDGKFALMYQKDPVDPADVLTGGKPPAGASIVNKVLVWDKLFIGKGVILSNSMLNGYKIANVTPAAPRQGYTLDIVGDEVIATFNTLTIVNGNADVYLVKVGSNPNDGYDALMKIEFRGRHARPGEDEWSGCNAISSLLVLLAIVPFVLRRKN